MPSAPQWPAAAAVGAVAGVLAATAGVLVSLPNRLEPWWVWLPMQAVGLAFTTAGVLARVRRPTNGTGRLLTAVGIAWYLVDLRNSTIPVVFAIGFILFYLGPVIFTHLVLALPSGRLGEPAERAVAGALYGCVVITQTLRYLTEHPRPPQSWSTQDGIQSIWDPLASITGSVLTAAAMVLIVRRWRAAGRPARRTHALVWITGTAIGLTVLITALANVLDMSERMHHWLAVSYTLGLILTPFAILAGVLRVRIARMRVANLVLRLETTPEPRHLRGALADALGDPTLQVCFRRPDSAGYVDGDGLPILLPDTADRALTPVERTGNQLAVLVHDPVLGDQRPLVDAVVAAARLALDNARLHAEQRAQLEEVRASRARIMAAADDERRRIQRDLHDGVQHTLLAISMLINRAGQELRNGSGDMAGLLDTAGARLRELTRELRHLTEGILPPSLTEQGLSAVVESLAERAPLPVRFSIPARRWPDPVERAVYFVINEAMANVCKHARATAATIDVADAGDRVVVRIADDGIGAADPDRGSGLRGLRDRVSVLGGRLTIRSVAGSGTRIEAVLPCG